MLEARPEPLNLSLLPQLARTLALAHKRPSRASGFVLGREPAEGECSFWPRNEPASREGARDEG